MGRLAPGGAAGTRFAWVEVWEKKRAEESFGWRGGVRESAGEEWPTS